MDGAQVLRDLVTQHIDETKAEEVWRIATVGTRDHVAAGARRATRPAVAASAAVDESGTQVALTVLKGDGSLDIPIKAAEADETAKGADKAFKAVVKPRKAKP